nr:CBO0543 family protein [Halalkalibacter akibai]
MFVIWLYRKEPRIVISIFPIAIVISLLFNIIGFHMEWWVVHPAFNLNCITALPYDLGFYPMSASFLIYGIKKYFNFRFYFILIFSLVITFLEWVAVELNYVEYGQGWNILWTFLSYLVALQLVYLYYLLVERKLVNV